MLEEDSPNDNRRKDESFVVSRWDVSSNANERAEGEKGRMKYLNNHLAEYISSVKELKAANKQLEAENEKFLNQLNEPETDYFGRHWNELEKIRKEIQELQRGKKEGETERDELCHRLQETDTRLKKCKTSKEKLEKEVKNKIIEAKESSSEKSSLEHECEAKKNQISLLKKVHEGEMNNLQRQFDASESSCDVQSERSFCVGDMNEAIEELRAEYAEYNAKALSDKDEQHKDKMEQLSKTLQEVQEENEKLLNEKLEKTNRNRKLEMEAELVRSKNEVLNRSVNELRDRTSQEAKENQEELDKLNRELNSTKEDLGKYLKEYRDLNELKLSLEQEIDSYHELLNDEDLLDESDRSSSSPSSASSSRSSYRRSSLDRSSPIVSETRSKTFTKTHITRYEDEDSDPIVEEFDGILSQEEVDKLSEGFSKVEVKVIISEEIDN